MFAFFETKIMYFGKKKRKKLIRNKFVCLNVSYSILRYKKEKRNLYCIIQSQGVNYKKSLFALKNCNQKFALYKNNYNNKLRISSFRKI